MSVNIIEAIQKNLGYPVLHKIDPNTQQVQTDKEIQVPEGKFSQAAIPAVLTGLYKYVQTDEGAEDFLRGENSTTWVSRIFDDKRKEAVKTISAYANQSIEDPIAKMNEIANEAVKIVKDNLHANPAIKEVKLFFSNQKNNILLYLPAELNMGELLHDTTLDDKTNKMEGPISTLMQNIGSAFTKPVADEEIQKH